MQMSQIPSARAFGCAEHAGNRKSSLNSASHFFPYALARSYCSTLWDWNPGQRVFKSHAVGTVDLQALVQRGYKLVKSSARMPIFVALCILP